MQITPSANLIAALSSLGKNGSSGVPRATPASSAAQINPVPPVTSPPPRQIIPQISPQTVQPVSPSEQNRNPSLGRYVDIRI